MGWLPKLYLWACERLYYELAPYFDVVSWLVSFGQWRRWQRGVWALVQGADLIELGCGTGAMLAGCPIQSGRIVGIDLSPRMVAIATGRLAASRSDAKVARASGYSLPFTNNAFDTVFATFPAGYILAPTTLAEVRRVLRHRGRFIALGLWVELHIGGLARLIPLFFSKPSEAMLQRIADSVAETGFRVQWVRQRHGFATVGVLVAERED